MKKNLFLFIAILLLHNILSSQIVIEQTDFAQPSDTFLLKVIKYPTMDFDLSTGGDKVWNYSSLNTQLSINNFACYAPKEKLDAVSNFPFEKFPFSQFFTYGPGYIYAGPGGVAPTESNWGHMLFFKNETGLYAEGFYSDYGLGYKPTLYNQPEMLMFAPASYLDTKEYHGYWKVAIDYNPADYDTTYRRNVDKKLEVDAWGTLTIPRQLGSFETEYTTHEVIRVHETGFSRDSIFITYNPVPTPFFSYQIICDTLNNYYFWAKEIRNPLLTIKCDPLGKVKEVNYLWGKNLLTVNKTPPTEHLKFFPNPAKDILHFSTETQVEIIDIQGRTLLKTEQSVKHININNLKPGIYFIKLDGNSVGKFIKDL